MEDAQKLFPSAAAVTPDAAISSLWHASDAAGQPVGSVLRTSPAADEIVGYQGPTESRIGIAPGWITDSRDGREPVSTMNLT